MQLPRATSTAIVFTTLLMAAGCGQITQQFGSAPTALSATAPSAIAVPDEATGAIVEALEPTEYEVFVPGEPPSSTMIPLEMPDNPAAVPTTYLNGIDVSKYEPDFSAESVPADFVVLRASRGLDEIDATVAAKYELAKTSGKLLGLYHYSDADFGNDPIVEADIFVAGARELGAVGEALLILDHEEASEAAGGAEWALKFLDRVHDTTGVTPLIYGSRGSLCKESYTEVAANYPLWVAKYIWAWEPVYGYHPDADPGDVSPWTAPIMFQYTPMGFLPGLDEELDVNVFYGNKADWQNLAASH